MIDIGPILDLIAFIGISLSLFYAVKIYRWTKLNDFLWLVFAMLYGSILRLIHLSRNFNIPVPSPIITSRLFSLFYVLLFLGVRGLYKPLKRFWNNPTRR